MGYQAYDVNMLDGAKTHIVILDRTAVRSFRKTVYDKWEVTNMKVSAATSRRLGKLKEKLPLKDAVEYQNTA